MADKEWTKIYLLNDIEKKIFLGRLGVKLNGI